MSITERQAPGRITDQSIKRVAHSHGTLASNRYIGECTLVMSRCCWRMTALDDPTIRPSLALRQSQGTRIDQVLGVHNALELSQQTHLRRVPIRQVGIRFANLEMHPAILKH